MFEMVKKMFRMSEEGYEETLKYYIKKFGLLESWSFKVVEKIPQVKTNYPDPEKVLAVTDWFSMSVAFKRSIFSQPKILVRAYIRHELRHCQQMQIINQKMRDKYGDLGGIYFQTILVNDMLQGYNKSIMEQDAWCVFFGIYFNIEKVTNRIIKRSLSFITE